jgi:hypothetical protein
VLRVTGLNGTEIVSLRRIGGGDFCCSKSRIGKVIQGRVFGSVIHPQSEVGSLLECFGELRERAEFEI